MLILVRPINHTGHMHPIPSVMKRTKPVADPLQVSNPLIDAGGFRARYMPSGQAYRKGLRSAMHSSISRVRAGKGW